MKIQYFNIKDGVFEQLSVTDVSKMCNEPSNNKEQVALGLQLGIQYHIASLLSPAKITPPSKKKTYKKKATRTKST